MERNSIDVDTVLKLVDKLSSERANWVSLWDECITLCDPTRKTSGEKQAKGNSMPAPVDGTGVRACASLAGNLYANGCAEGQEWFSIGINLPEKKIEDSQRRWAIDSTKTILRYLSSGGFYAYAQEATRALCCLGTSIGFVQMKKKKLVFKNFNVNDDIYIQSNEDGDVDTLARTFSLTAKEAIQMFGDSVSEEIKAELNKGTSKTFEFVQFVYPRKVYGQQIDTNRKDKKNMPFGSVFIERAKKSLVKEEGFRQFPFAVARFYKSSNEDYGRSPAMIALEDLKTLQRITNTLITHASYNANPALAVDDRAEEFSTEEGSINRIAGLSNGMIQKIDLAGDININNDTMKMFQDAVRETFFYSHFMALEQHQYMTAREVDARELQKAQSIAPVVTSYQNEFLGKTIMLVYSILRRNNIIPAPPNMKDEDVNVVYTSRLNNFLKMVGVANLMTALSQAGSVFELFGKVPDASLFFNQSKILELIAVGNNVDTSVFYSAKETAKMKEAMKAEQEAMMSRQALMDKVKPIDPLKEPQAGSLYSTMQKVMG